MSNFTKTYWLSFLFPFILLLVLFVLPFIFTTVLPSQNYVIYQITNILSGIVGWLLFNILVYVFNWLLCKFIIQYVRFGFWCYCVVAIVFALANYAFLAFIARANMRFDEIIVSLVCGVAYALVLNIVAFLINRKFKNKAIE